MTRVIALFDNKREYAFLSNFWKAPLDLEGKVWPTSEHFFQAQKTLDEEKREAIRLVETPGQAKRLGRKCAIRPDWEDVKYGVMLKALQAKFSQHQDLKQKLLATGDAILVEANTWHDNTWGVCLCDECPGTGKNLLGEALMEVRQDILVYEKIHQYFFEHERMDAVQFCVDNNLPLDVVERVLKNVATRV